MQLRSPEYRIHLVVTAFVFIRCTHITLRIDGVIIAPAGRRSYRHTSLEDRTSLRHRHQRVPATIRPSPDTDSLFVDISLLTKPQSRFHLITCLEFTQTEIGTFLEVSPSATSSAIIHTNTDIALLSQILLQDSTLSAHTDSPLVQHLLITWATILIHNHRILGRRIEIGRLHHPSIQFHTLRGRE